MRSCAGTSPVLFINVVNHILLCRLNAHLSSIVSSKPFQMPVEVISRTTALSGSRLSSFGFSGTIAHGGFGAPGSVPASDLYSPSASLYRARHHLPQNKHIARLSVARGVGSDPFSTSTGRPAAYCKVQTILRPDSCQCVTHKIIQAAEIDQDHKKKSSPLDTINVTMGSWKRLLGTARNA